MIEGKTVFYRHYFDNGVIFTKDLLYATTNTQSFRKMKEQGLTNSNFLVWTGLRPSVPSKLRVNICNFKTLINLENYKCKNYYYHLIKFKYETLREMSGVVVLKSYDTDPYFSKIRTYREVPRFKHATCTSGGRTRIRSDSDFFRSMENQIWGHVIDTRCVKVMIFIHSSRFCGKYRRTAYESCGSTDAFNSI